MHIGILSVLLGLLAPPALAATMQDLADCRVTENHGPNVAACTRVIENTATPDDERAFAIFNRASASESKGAYDEALADYTALLATRPIALVYANRGLVFQRLQDNRRSIADLGEALRRDPTLSQAHKWRAVSHFKLGDHQAALADLDAAQRLDPNDSEVCAKRAWVFETVGDFKSALADNNAYLDREPRSVSGLVRRAQIFVALGDPEHALADLRDAMSIEPANAPALVVRGNAYRRQGDLVRAIDDYTAAIVLRPFAEAYHERGVAWRMAGDVRHAMDDFKMAVRLRPKHSPASVAELKALGIDYSNYDPNTLPKAKDLLDALK
jgi:tetratricopeptide (TPR) repeat protein